MHAIWKEHIESISDDDKGILPTERQIQTSLPNVDEEARGTILLCANTTGVLRMGLIGLFLMGALYPGSAQAQSYSVANAVLCNRGEVDLLAILGEASTRGFMGWEKKAIGFYAVDRGDCTTVNFYHDRSFNLTFMAYDDKGKWGYFQFDATKEEILYKNPSDWSKSKLKDHYADGYRAGGNAGGRTCASNDGEPFSIELSSWEWDDPCPSGYYAVALSNWIRVAYEARTVEVYLYPKKKNWQSLEGNGVESNNSPASEESNDLSVSEGEAINKLLVGTSCNRGGAAWIRYRDPVVFSIGASGEATYVTENFVNGVLTKRSIFTWDLSDLDGLELRSGGKCAVLNVICKNEQKCIRADDGWEYDNKWLYFSDTGRAEVARALLMNMGVN